MRETKVIVKCDRCGWIIEGDEFPVLVSEITNSSGDFIKPEAGMSFDLCPECMETVIRMISEHAQRPVDPEQPEPEQPKKRRYKQADLGKMKALYDAGWDYKKISEEMQLPYSTVYNTINYKILEKGEQQ